MAPRVLGMLPPEMDRPQGFKTAWVFNHALQAAILDAFYESVEKDTSLALFYTKGAHPLGDDIPRLVVGVGSIERIGQLTFYDSTHGSMSAHPIWEREIAHSLRPGGERGLLVPFSDYLTPTGDEDEDARRAILAKRLVIEPDQDRMGRVLLPDGTHHTRRDDRRAHEGHQGRPPSPRRWDRGRILGSSRKVAERAPVRHLALERPESGRRGLVLEAMGLRMGVSLVQLAASRDPQFAADPWAAVSQLLDGVTPPPDGRFQADIDAFASLWVHHQGQPERMELARCLSRLAITPDQALRWWNKTRRTETAGYAVSDREIIDNPYIVAELDRGRRDSRPVSFPTVDLGALSAGGQASVLSPADRRRLRAALVADTPKGGKTRETPSSESRRPRNRAARIPVAEPVVVPDGWASAEIDFLSERVVATDGDPRWLQLIERRDVAGMLQRKLWGSNKQETPQPRRAVEGHLGRDGGEHASRGCPLRSE